MPISNNVSEDTGATNSLADAAQTEEGRLINPHPLPNTSPGAVFPSRRFPLAPGTMDFAGRTPLSAVCIHVPMNPTPCSGFISTRLALSPSTASSRPKSEAPNSSRRRRRDVPGGRPVRRFPIPLWLPQTYAKYCRVLRQSNSVHSPPNMTTNPIGRVGPHDHGCRHWPRHRVRRGI